MQVLRIDLVQPGQVTAERILNSAGGTLIGSGTTLSAGHIRSLKAAGVETVTIVADGDEAAAGENSLASRLAGLEARFEGATNPILLQIQQAAAARLRAMMTGLTQ